MTNRFSAGGKTHALRSMLPRPPVRMHAYGHPFQSIPDAFFVCSSPPTTYHRLFSTSFHPLASSIGTPRSYCGERQNRCATARESIICGATIAFAKNVMQTKPSRAHWSSTVRPPCGDYHVGSSSGNVTLTRVRAVRNRKPSISDEFEHVNMPIRWLSTLMQCHLGNRRVHPVNTEKISRTACVPAVRQT